MELQTNSALADAGEASIASAVRTEEIRRRIRNRMLNAANNQAAISTTGSKRNAKSKAGRFRARKRAKLITSERVMQC